VVGTCGWHPNDGDRSAEQAVAADRFAREIVRFLTHFVARSRRLNGRRSASGERRYHPFCDMMGLIAHPERRLCQSRGMQVPVMPEWYEGPFCGLPVVPGVVRKPVVLRARYGQPDRVLGVVQIKVRCAGRDSRCVWF